MFHEALAMGRRQRRDMSRWETPFGRWVGDIGVPGIVGALARDPRLAVTNKAVYHWLQGRAVPSPARAMALVALSGGRLNLETIYQHSLLVRDPDGLLGAGATAREGTLR